MALKISPEGIVTAQNGNLEGDSAMAFYQGEKDKMQDDFVRTSVLNEEGEFLSSDAQFQAQALGLGDAIDRVREEIGAGKADEAAAAARPSDEEATAQVMEMYPTARDMAMAPEVLERVDSVDKLFDRLAQFYPDMSDQELSALLLKHLKINLRHQQKESTYLKVVTPQIPQTLVQAQPIQKQKRMFLTHLYVLLVRCVKRRLWKNMSVFCQSTCSLQAEKKTM